MKIYDILISGVIEVKNIGRKNTQLILSGNIPKALLSLAIPIVINGSGSVVLIFLPKNWRQEGRN